MNQNRYYVLADCSVGEGGFAFFFSVDLYFPHYQFNNDVREDNIEFWTKRNVLIILHPEI